MPVGDPLPSLLTSGATDGGGGVTSNTGCRAIDMNEKTEEEDLAACPLFVHKN